MRHNHFANHLLIILLILFCNTSYGQQLTRSKIQTTSNIHSVIDSLLKKDYEDKMFPGAGITLFENDSTQFFNSGYAKIESKVAVTKQTKFQLGSIGKLLTAISVLQLVNQGKLEVNTDITQYIKEHGLNLGSYDTPVTLHCLLTHSCGFNDANIGYMAKDTGNTMQLSEYIKKTNPKLFQAPGVDINYSNFSYALAGLIVQEVTNTKFETYVDKNIFNQLGMSNSTLIFPVGYKTNPGYANAYTKTADDFKEVEIHPRHATPAGSLISNSEDMGLFIKALFNKNTSLLSAESWELFYTQQFKNHPLLNGYGYGLEHQNINGFESWAKGGMLPGVLSHILIVPNEFAIFSVVNTSNDNFGETLFKTIFDKAFPDSTSVKELSKGVSTTNYTGVYRNKRYNRNTEENIITLFRGEWRVYNNEFSDTLVVHHNGKWHSYLPINNGVFQNESLPYEYLVFKKNEKGEITSLFRNLNIGGLSIPTSYEKTTWYNSPEFINEHYGLIPLFTFTGLLFMLFSLLVRLIRKWKKDFFRLKELPTSFHILFGSIIILHILHTFIVPWQILTNSQEFLFGYPSNFKVASLIGYLLIPLAIGLGLYIWKIWANRLGSLFTRFYLTLIEVSLLIHIAFLFYWSFF